MRSQMIPPLEKLHEREIEHLVQQLQGAPGPGFPESADRSGFGAEEEFPPSSDRSGTIGGE